MKVFVRFPVEMFDNLCTIVRNNGSKGQMSKTREELEELEQVIDEEIQKSWRAMTDAEKEHQHTRFVDEIADVIVTICGLMRVLHIPEDEVFERMKFKITRQVGRIEHREYLSKTNRQVLDGSVASFWEHLEQEDAED